MRLATFQFTERETVMQKSLLAVTLAPPHLRFRPRSRLCADRCRPAAWQRSFKTSCNEVAQRRFDRGMRYQHSYWYLKPRVFEEASGRSNVRHGALGHRAHSWTTRTTHPAAQPRARPCAITKAKEVGAKTERERDYIDALMVMYADYDKIPHAQRMRALRDASEGRGEISGRRRGQIAYASRSTRRRT